MLSSTLRLAGILSASFAFTLACSPPAPAPGPGTNTPGDNTPGGMNPGGMNPGNNNDPGGGIMDPGDPEPPGATPTPQEVFPYVAHLGYDGTNTYRVPMLTDLTGTVTWTFSDPALATATPIPAANLPADLAQIPDVQWVMIEAKKAGTGKVTASNGTTMASADLVISSYTAQQFQAGQTRYMNGCAGCHAGAGGVDHSPTILVFSSDEDLLAAITTGAYPDGYKLRAPNHTFALAEPERTGILAYIRSRPPRDFK